MHPAGTNIIRGVYFFKSLPPLSKKIFIFPRSCTIYMLAQIAKQMFRGFCCIGENKRFLGKKYHKQRKTCFNVPFHIPSPHSSKKHPPFRGGGRVVILKNISNLYNVHTLDKLEIDPCEWENEGVLVLPQRECGRYLTVRLRQLAPGVGGGGG